MEIFNSCTFKSASKFRKKYYVFSRKNQQFQKGSLCDPVTIEHFMGGVHLARFHRITPATF